MRANSCLLFISNHKALAAPARAWVVGLDLDDETGERFADWLRSAYLGSAKRIAREWRVSECTVRHWLAGQLPAPATRLAMLDRWGASLLAKVVAPDDVAVRAAAIEQDIREHEEWIELQRRELAGMGWHGQCADASPA